MIKNIRTFAIAFVALGSLSIPAAAETSRASFSYELEELNTEKGAKAVYLRLQTSAKRACERQSPLLKRDEFQCRREIEAKLLAQTASKTLYAFHDEAMKQTKLASAE